MLRVAICDDEAIFAEELEEILKKYMMKRGLAFEIDTYISGEMLAALEIETMRYTVIFLDVKMHNMDGITAAWKIRKVNSEVFIVFVAACMDYSLEGYRLDAIRYLLKGSINFEETVYECMDAVLTKLNYSVVKKKFYFKEGVKEVSLDRLLYIESMLHKLEFHIMDESIKIYTMYETLNEMESRLSEDNFIRIHQSYLVNMKYLKNVIRYKAILANGIELIIPKARYTYVRDKFIEYHGEI